MDLFLYMVKSAFRNPRRTGLTAVSLAISMSLVVILQTILLEITKPVGIDESIPRIVVRHRTALTLSLPRPYERKLERVPGIVAVTPMDWFGGIWKDDRFENFFPRFAVDPNNFFDVYIDYKPDTPEMLRAFQNERRGAMIGRKLATRHGFKLGDTITIKGDIYPVDLEVRVVGFFDGPQSDWLIFQLKYLDELLGETVRPGSFFALVESPARVDSILPEIEAMFRNSDAEVKAETEKAFQLSFVEMLGNVKLLINSLVSVVVFAVVMIAASTMALAIRDHTREVATLKAIGFTRPIILGLIVGEGMVVSLVGGGIGLFLSWLLLPQPSWMLAAIGGLVVAGGLGLPMLLLSVILPEVSTGGRIQRALAGARRVMVEYGPPVSIMTGVIVMLLLLQVVPPMDWFTFSGGAIQSFNMRNETLVLGVWITLGVGLISSIIPAWQASRLSVLDGLRTLE